MMKENNFNFQELTEEEKRKLSEELKFGDDSFWIFLIIMIMCGFSGWDIPKTEEENGGGH